MLFFYYTVQFSIVPPQIIPFDFGEDSVNENDGISVQCTVSKGDYPLNITWLLNEQRIEESNGILISRASKRVSTLSIDAAQSTHAGNYTCFAKNLAASTSYTTTLLINGKFIGSFFVFRVYFFFNFNFYNIPSHFSYTIFLQNL